MRSLSPRQWEVLQAVADGRVQRDLLGGTFEPYLLGRGRRGLDVAGTDLARPDPVPAARPPGDHPTGPTGTEFNGLTACDWCTHTGRGPAGLCPGVCSSAALFRMTALRGGEVYTLSPRLASSSQQTPWPRPLRTECGRAGPAGGTPGGESGRAVQPRSARLRQSFPQRPSPSWLGLRWEQHGLITGHRPARRRGETPRLAGVVSM